ncbi:MAG: hypothetical protein ACEY3B_04520 [Wolbachia sp.]
MTELTSTQLQIRFSLIIAIVNNNLKKVQDIFNNDEYDDIQAALIQRAPSGDKDIILHFAITRLKAVVKDQEDLEKSVKIIELIWQKTNQKIRGSVCGYAIESFQNFQRETGLSDIPALKTVIQEIEEHRRVENLIITLRFMIISLDVNQVKAALENCGTDAARVLEREVYWNNGRVDAFLVYPLRVKYSKELNQEDVEKIKEITKLLWNEASSNVRDFWLESVLANGDNYIIAVLKSKQEFYVKEGIAGEGWLEDLIEEVKDYKKSREEELSKRVLEDIEEKEPIADNETPGNSDTTFWSKHKGKIALSIVGLCAAGAVVAYVLAYPAVALALAVLAAVILIGVGIAKVLEDPSVEGLSTPKKQGA